MRKSGLAEKDIYDDSETVVRCVVGLIDGSKVGVGIH